MKGLHMLILVLLLALPLPVWAQARNSTNQTELIEKLLARIDQLERRVAELESKSEGAARLAPAAYTVPALSASAPPLNSTVPREEARAAQEPPPSPHQEHLQQPQAAAAQQTYPSLKLAGFSDFNFAATDQRGFRSGFTEGQFTFHLTSPLSPKVNVFSELTFTARADAGTGAPAATGFNAEVERIIVRYEQSDHLKVSFGRYHTPINWWNTAFHHGQWLQTSISRPEMTQFGGRFIPVHFVGGLVEGAVPAHGLNLNYNVGIGNGRGSVISRGGDAGDNNNSRAWLVNLFTKPDRFFGLQVGGSVYRDKMTLASGREFREWISAGHIVWSKENPEVIAEFANVNHQEVGRTFSFNSQAYYVQVGYRLPWGEKLWKPYYRFEYIHIPRTDAAFQGVPSLAGSVVGLRYDISEFAALKAEYRNLRRLAGQPRVNGVFLQTSFTF